MTMMMKILASGAGLAALATAAPSAAQYAYPNAYANQYGNPYANQYGSQYANQYGNPYGSQYGLNNYGQLRSLMIRVEIKVAVKVHETIACTHP